MESRGHIQLPQLLLEQNDSSLAENYIFFIEIIWILTLTNCPLFIMTIIDVIILSNVN